MKTAITVLLVLGHIIAGIVVLFLHERKKLPSHVSDIFIMFNMIPFVEPVLFVFLGILLWPFPLILGFIFDKLSLKTSLKPGDGKD